MSEAHSHQELLFKKYKVFWEKKKEKVYIKISSHIKS